MSPHVTDPEWADVDAWEAERVARAAAPASTNGVASPTATIDLFPLLSVADLANLEPPAFLIDSLLPAGGLSVLFGPSGVGKSFLALDWALCVSTGLAWYGQETKPGGDAQRPVEREEGLLSLIHI